MNRYESNITIIGTPDRPVSELQNVLNIGEIGIRVLKPAEFRYDFVCKDKSARNTLIYLLERLCACIVYKEISAAKSDDEIIKSGATE